MTAAVPSLPVLLDGFPQRGRSAAHKSGVAGHCYQTWGPAEPPLRSKSPLALSVVPTIGGIRSLVAFSRLTRRLKLAHRAAKQAAIPPPFPRPCVFSPPALLLFLPRQV